MAGLDVAAFAYPDEVRRGRRGGEGDEGHQCRIMSSMPSLSVPQKKKLMTDSPRRRKRTEME